MKRFGSALAVLLVGLLSALALVASAAGTTATHGVKVRHLQGPVGALAIDGSRIAYDASAKLVTKPHATNKVLVWNVRTGETVKVSGAKTAVSDGVGGDGVFQLAIAGPRVAWLVNEGGNLENEDYLFTSSVTSPKERKVASALRTGDNCAPGRAASRCAGPWLGGLVGSGNLIAMNRWTTDGNGAVTAGELDVLSGTKLKQVAAGANTVQATAADGGRVAVLRVDGRVTLYSAAGKLLLTVDTPADTEAVALRGKDLVVGTKTRQLELYNAHTGSLRKTINVRGSKQPRNLGVEGNIAIYTTGNAGVLHAVNVSTGKDRPIAEPDGGVVLAQIDSAGLVYAANGFGTNYGKGKLVFVPMTRLKAAVG